jgi:hypothetical protein
MLNSFGVTKYTFSSVLARALICIVPFSAAAANPDDEAYSILKTIATVASTGNDGSGCPVLGTIDFNGFYAQLPVFREACSTKIALLISTTREESKYSYTPSLSASLKS